MLQTKIKTPSQDRVKNHYQLFFSIDNACNSCNKVTRSRLFIFWAYSIARLRRFSSKLYTVFLTRFRSIRQRHKSHKARFLLLLIWVIILSNSSCKFNLEKALFLLSCVFQGLLCGFLLSHHLRIL